MISLNAFGSSLIATRISAITASIWPAILMRIGLTIIVFGNLLKFLKSKAGFGKIRLNSTFNFKNLGKFLERLTVRRN